VIEWVDVASSADVLVGDTVKVSSEAYKNQKIASMHNGRICKVVNIQDGDVVVASIDGKLPYLRSTRHAPHFLRKMVVHADIH
jgi:hypothetical protein